MNWLCFFFCAPIALIALAWLAMCMTRQWPNQTGLLPALLATGNAIFGFRIYLHLRWSSTAASVPPWQDPIVLNAAILGLLAPVALVWSLVAGFRGMSWWLVGVVVLSSIPLCIVGCVSGATV